MSSADPSLNGLIAIMNTRNVTYAEEDLTRRYTNLTTDREKLECITINCIAPL